VPRFKARFVSYVPVLAEVELEAATLAAARAKADDLARDATCTEVPDELARSFAPQWEEIEEVEALSVEELPPRALHS